MKSETYPLALPSDLLKEVRKAAKKTGLSMADAMRQSMKLGLPKLVEELSMEQVLKNLKPISPAESRQCWEDPNEEFDALEHHCATHPYQVAKPEE
jgi:ribbon-helix-helix CopG family protein